MSERAWWSSDWELATRREVSLSVVMPVYNERYLVGAMLSQLSDLERNHLREAFTVVKTLQSALAHRRGIGG